MQLICDLCKSE